MPADTAVAIGAFLSRHGTVAAGAVFGITLVANVGAATAVYAAGRTLGRQFFTGRLGRRLLRPARLRRIEQLYRRFGVRGIFLSRFLPGVRAVVPPFAGMARVPAGRAILAMATASALWYGTLTIVVVSAADRIEDVARLLTHLNVATVVVTAAIATGVIAWVVWRRRARRADAP